jgi:hypothetical protein
MSTASWFGAGGGQLTAQPRTQLLGIGADRDRVVRRTRQMIAGIGGDETEKVTEVVGASYAIHLAPRWR